uniref:Uncharacterized protein n=1 Tax=Osmundea sinicola TaxID=290685 RepID=A0A7L4WNN4_9FLOR|nr:hypothetical protein [Osmundea sinicola]QFR99864.1 hypothetical protein [Osmundea sinicola]
MPFNFKNIDQENIETMDYNQYNYMYNYNTEEVDISNNASHIFLDETIHYYTDFNRKMLNSDDT